jgi:hypothetical protein
MRKNHARFADPVQACWSLQILDIVKFATLSAGYALLGGIANLLDLGLEISHLEHLFNLQGQGDTPCF